MNIIIPKLRNELHTVLNLSCLLLTLVIEIGIRAATRKLDLVNVQC